MIRDVSIVRSVLEGLLRGKTFVVVLRHDRSPAEGKFLVGSSLFSDDTIALVFDNRAASHRELAGRYNLHPWGGGWLSLDDEQRRVRITGVSQDYGKEPDRDLTVRALKLAFPDYEVTEL